jgi:hypothetical protein
MPSIVNTESFLIQPPAHLLQTHPELKRLSTELSIKYAHNELVTDELLRATGEALWRSLELDTVFEELHTNAGRQILPTVIESDEPAILRLPWETLSHPQHGFLGIEPGFTLSRRLISAPIDHSKPETGPLRVLLFTAMTEDQARLNVEEEQALVQEALMPLIAKGIVKLESGPLAQMGIRYPH